MTKYEKDYIDLLNRVLNNADDTYKKNRTKSKCLSKFGESITVDLKNKHGISSFPILIGRKMYPKTFFTELKWFMEGETNIKRFQDAGIKIWDKWADKRGELGPVYGFQLRKWGGMRVKHPFDQLNDVMYNLKYMPESRRHVVTLWDPFEIDDMALPPCYHSFTFNVTNGKLNCHVSMRSSDVFVGLPYDIALFATMVHLMCHSLSPRMSLDALIPGKLHFSLTDAHIYWQNMDAVQEYLEDMKKGSTNPGVPPALVYPFNQDIYNFNPEDLLICNYTPKKSYKVEVVE